MPICRFLQWRTSIVGLVLFTLCSVGTAVFLSSAALAQNVVLSEQEIRDLIEWGLERNRTPEDIQQDIDGLNEARGGSGRVPLPVQVHAVQTRDGHYVTATFRERIAYENARMEMQDIRSESEELRQALNELESESQRWSAWERNVEWRFASGLDQLTDAYSEYQAKLDEIEEERAHISKYPDRMVYDSERYSSYAEAVRAWENRHRTYDSLRRERGKALGEYIDKVRAMTEKDPESAEGTSMFNRPTAMLDEIGQQQDAIRQQVIQMQEQQRILNEKMKALEERAQQNQRTYPGHIPPAPEQPPTPPDADTTDADTAKSEPESIGDALADVRADEEEGEGEDTGEDAEDEILDDIQRKFDEAVRRFYEHHSDFIARLQSLAGESSDAICGDGTLAFSLAAASDAFLEVEGYYTDALAAVRLAGNLSAAATGRTPAAAEDFDPANVEGLGVFDQIAMRMMQEDYAAVLADVEDMGTRLNELAPGCDPEEMLDAGRRVAETDQDPESGVDITGGPRDGGGGIGGNGELRFEADQLGSETDFSASCTGGSMTLNMDPPTFPQTILPDGSYTVSVSVSWSTSGSEIKDVSMLVSILVNQELRIEREFETFSGSRTVTATVRGSDIDFSEQVIAMSVVVGGGLLCENNSSDGLGAVYNQIYFRRGSE